MTYSVVDLGSKRGNAAAEFLKLISKPDKARLEPLRGDKFLAFDYPANQVICYDKSDSEEYEAATKKRGYSFESVDLASDDVLASLPEAKVYLAWHFLEHLPNKEWSSKVVKAALSKSKYLAWFRLPSFQLDEKGEMPLRRLGLRFTWTNWSGHPSHWLVEDCLTSINEWQATSGRPVSLKVKAADYIASTHDKRVVPIDSPVDTTVYEAVLGPRPFREFKPRLIAAWDILVSLQ